MRHRYICLDCVEAKTGKSAYDLPVEVFNNFKATSSFHTSGQCPECGSKRITKIFGVETSYVRGYGYADKAGIRNDMNIHSMITGSDPYKEHRQSGETHEVIRKLQKAKEFDSKPKVVRLSK